jgi:signal transduction histidine kinase
MAGLDSRFAASLRLFAALCAVAWGMAALALLRGRVPPVSYAAVSSTGALTTTAAGFALITCGALVGVGRRNGPLGDLVVVAGVTWFAPLWLGWQAGSPLLRSVAAALSAFTFPLLVHVAVAWPGGRLSPHARAFLVAVYAETGLAVTVQTLFRDPYLDARCWSNCTVNMFLLRSEPGLASSGDAADRAFLVAVAGVLIAVCGWRLATATSTGRRRLAPALAPVVVMAMCVIAKFGRLQQTSVEDPFDQILFTTFLVGSVAVVCLSAGLAWSVVQPQLAKRALRRILATMRASPPPGSVENALTSVLGDPKLRLHYWLAREQRFVDSAGRPPTNLEGLSATRLRRAEQPLASVCHSVPAAELERQLTPAILLGIDNERLQVEINAELQELRASRARIVETADRERRQLERDLHDGAQQHVLALTYELRVARAGATGALAARLATAGEQAQAALNALRELAHGIYPAALSRSGLAQALDDLADTAGLAVTIETGEGRYPPAVEAAAYFTVREALEEALTRGAGQASVTCRAEDGTLTVAIEDDGSRRSDPLVPVADQVGALGGTVHFEPTRCMVVIPCE